MNKLLYTHQIEALKRMHNGCILCGGVGSGKSRTSLAYYFNTHGGNFDSDRFKRMTKPCDLYIITTRRKRDTKEWEDELKAFDLVTGYSVSVTIDSWNNIKKYSEVDNAFFIFDEQRVVGSGAWVKAFLKIVKRNEWILLSATPGDTWNDYVPVFIRNGFYRNKTAFIQEHVIYSRFSKYPKIDRYVNTGRLIKCRDHILVNMDFDRKTVQHHIDIWTQYDPSKYKMVTKERWNYNKNMPIVNAAELCYELRRVCNSDKSRLFAVKDIVEEKKKVIIFYNFDYELELIKLIDYDIDISVAEWNGHKHEPIPKSENWVYLVQYTAGAEGWNCTETDTILFYSQNYSYKVMLQSSGRIDRLNTPFTDLYFYHLKSRSGIDIAISRALSAKKKFNEDRFVNRGK